MEETRNIVKSHRSIEQKEQIRKKKVMRFAIPLTVEVCH